MQMTYTHTYGVLPEHVASFHTPALFSDDDYPPISEKTAAAREHCKWAYDAGETPQDVLKSVGRPSHSLSTWEDACRAVESGMYAMDHQAEADAYKDMLSRL